jgi:5-oxoprolinase (ATP-hydrolysing)
MFGGAGGQLGTGIADVLGIPRVILPRFSSILSAYGMALADVVTEAQEPAAFGLQDTTADQIEAYLAKLESDGTAKLQSQGFPTKSLRVERYLNCRYQGSTTQLMIEQPADYDFAKAFIQEHKEQFGFTLVDRPIVVDDVRVRCIGVSESRPSVSPQRAMKAALLRRAKLESFETQGVYFDNLGFLDTPVVALDKLAEGEQVDGPAILFDTTQTIVIEPGWVGTALAEHVVIDLVVAKPPKAELDANNVDPVELSVMGHRFMSIAEQMGNVLRQTAISVNIKERLDFSCALFSPDGGLVANAPHSESEVDLWRLVADSSPVSSRSHVARRSVSGRSISQPRGPR